MDLAKQVTVHPYNKIPEASKNNKLQSTAYKTALQYIPIIPKIYIKSSVPMRIRREKPRRMLLKNVKDDHLGQLVSEGNLSHCSVLTEKPGFSRIFVNR